MDYSIWLNRVIDNRDLFRFPQHGHRSSSEPGVRWLVYAMITIVIGIALHSGAWNPRSARFEFSETRKVVTRVFREIHHRRGLTFSPGSGHIGILVYAIMTALNVLTIRTFYRWVKIHPDAVY